MKNGCYSELPSEKIVEVKDITYITKDSWGERFLLMVEMNTTLIWLSKISNVFFWVGMKYIDLDNRREWSFFHITIASNTSERTTCFILKLILLQKA